MLEMWVGGWGDDIAVEACSGSEDCLGLWKSKCRDLETLEAIAYRQHKVLIHQA